MTLEAGFKFIDLFCGIGGFHQAMTSLGGVCVYACDIDANCRATYKENYKIEPDTDITKVDPANIPEFDVLCGGFPCQAFSIAGKRLGFDDIKRGTLFFDICRIIKHHHPKYILLENVKNLIHHDNGNTWKVIYQSLIDLGYSISKTPTIFSPQYLGIPQHRQRVFIMGIRKDLGRLPKFSFDTKAIPPTSINNILLDDNAIQDLESFKLAKDKVEVVESWGGLIKSLKCDKLPNMICADFLCSLEDNPLYTTIDKQPDYVQKAIKSNNELWKQNKEVIKEWLIKAEKCTAFYGRNRKLEWRTSKGANVWDCIITFRPSGIRIATAQYCPTLLTHASRPIIGCRKRYLTPREYARLQSFPDTFKMNKSNAQAYKQFGNSVNIECVKLFAKFLLGDKETREKYGAHKQQN